MIRVEQVNKVHKFSLARSFLGKGLYFTAAYWVDGMMVDTGCAHTVQELVESLKGYQESLRAAGVIPAKIFEYMYTGKPILLIGPEGFESELIRSTSTGVVARPHDVNDVKEKLHNLFLQHLNGVLSVPTKWEVVERYSRVALTKTFARKFDEVVRTGL